MPPNKYRSEVVFRPETKRLLESYRVQLHEKTGKRVSLSSLVDGIVSQFLDRNRIEEEVKKSSSSEEPLALLKR
jgi:hypothetical protein